MNTWTSYRGSRENTLAGLKHALEKVNKNAFVCVWTDELGDDNNDITLRNEVKSLKASTESVIFIMAKTNSKSRASGSLSEFETTFKDIGYVMDVDDPDVVDKMISLMKSSAVCNRNNSSTTPSQYYYLHK